MNKLRAAVVIVTTAVALVTGCTGRFPVLLEESRVIVDTMTLGEYGSSVSRILLTDAVSGQPVWDVDARLEPLWIHGVVLVAGPNDCVPIHMERANTTCAADNGVEIFDIEPGVGYRLQVWGEDQSRASATSQFTFEKPYSGDSVHRLRGTHLR